MAFIIPGNHNRKDETHNFSLHVMLMADFFCPKDADPEPVKEEQTEFTVTLTKFDDGSKVKLIKEIKIIMPEMNLVQVFKVGIKASCRFIASNIFKS